MQAVSEYWYACDGHLKHKIEILFSLVGLIAFRCDVNWWLLVKQRCMYALSTTNLLAMELYAYNGTFTGQCRLLPLCSPNCLFFTESLSFALKHVAVVKWTLHFHEWSMMVEDRGAIVFCLDENICYWLTWQTSTSGSKLCFFLWWRVEICKLYLEEQKLLKLSLCEKCMIWLLLVSNDCYWWAMTSAEKVNKMNMLGDLRLLSKGRIKSIKTKISM